MSMDTCKKCGHFVDTDFDDSAYDLGACLCDACRDEENERRDPVAIKAYWDNQDVGAA